MCEDDQVLASVFLKRLLSSFSLSVTRTRCLLNCLKNQGGSLGDREYAFCLPHPGASFDGTLCWFCESVSFAYVHPSFVWRWWCLSLSGCHDLVSKD